MTTTPQGATDNPSRLTTPVRVVIVDDHDLVRDGLRLLLSREADVEIVGEAAGVAEAVRRVAFEEPDVVTMDIDLPDGSGIDACAQITTLLPDTKVIVITAIAEPRAVADAREAGAKGFVLKRGRDFKLVEAIRAVAAGETAFGEAPAAADPPDPLLGRLTPRELRILELVADGKTNREIADELFLAEKTVKNYVSHLLAKTGFSHRAGAAAHLVEVRTRRESAYPNRQRRTQ
jgi:two-component system response regulator DevR